MPRSPASGAGSGSGAEAEARRPEIEPEIEFDEAMSFQCWLVFLVFGDPAPRSFCGGSVHSAGRRDGGPAACVIEKSAVERARYTRGGQVRGVKYMVTNYV